MPPVFLFGSGSGIEPSTRALNPTATPSAVAKRTTCSIGTPSDPVTAPERAPTLTV